ncbi:Cupin 2 conserved barrel domain protein [Candidatus Sulfotelmatomonas gaucii]|uniref:Cupin 2 conserved barrel domain protein n=1 Tax=Candidatus Sulfuritelmatomonas gaucii TaxID=2043161 RepID=A0A2N9LAD1_9BACT|nr:Cupin 2 conserved barrel domain protein [Candidatus Sulfotelmatomonas gaucii]
MTSPTLSALLLAFASVAAAQSATPNPLASSRVFAYEQMTAETAPNGAVGRSVFKGTLATGEAVAVHETTQPASVVPNPQHRIHHSEVIVVREGTLEFDHDGQAERAGPGSIIYVALDTLHSVRNIGSGPASYVVIQVGGDTKK